MKISYRIFLGFAVILAAGFCSLISWIMSDVNIQPKKSMEEPMVDMAHILASYLEQHIENEKISTAQLARFMDAAEKRKFSSRIYELVKKDTNLDIYVTDERGTVIFDSENGLRVGKDFSRYRDVYLTLLGRYGARTTRSDPSDPLTSVAYIAAPVYRNGEIIGVCTVSKPWQSINTFIDTTRRKIIAAGVVGFAAVLVLSFFIARWITSPIRRLMAYANSVKEGKRTTLPELGKGEIDLLGNSFQQMKESLEGKKYIEKFVQTLTHQLKGPLSAIRGASELLQEDLPETDRRRFVSNIETESRRIQRIVDRMLELASLEQQSELRNVETVDLSAMVTDIVEEMTVTLNRKEIMLKLNVGSGLCTRGERFLIHQAVFNLLQNAVDFTPAGGFIDVEIQEHFGRLILIIRDSGPGIPAYALDKIFDKFYSLQRPDTGQKSSGLGLSLVKEVADLHNGDITLKNNTPHGTVAILKLPY
ncbi:MAG: two-component system sensor histidine kinase CreC [bacterium]|nr:two-component system sensor histidine kinase CreC [bacterium]